jgi:hypothetical protein
MPKEKDLLKAKGKEKFPFGKHQGKTFEQIAFADPEYHKRYLYILGKKNKKPHGALAEYIDWFEMTKAKKTKTAGEGKGKRDFQSSGARGSVVPSKVQRNWL